MKRKICALAVLLSLLLQGCAATGRNGEVIEKKVTIESSVTLPENDNNRVFYQIFVGSFSDSDGDGTGDLRGIINRMDYLNDNDAKSGLSLGIEGIWLSPIFESPSYHKYDVKDYYAIDHEFGTMEDLKELVSVAHERNVKVILDLVINHSSRENQYFTEFSKAHREGDTNSTYYDFYCWTDKPEAGKTWRKINGTEHYYECNFSDDMPEMNYDSEAVRQWALEVAKYYLEEIDVDGFRFDAAKYIYYNDTEKNVDFWCWYIEKLKEIKPEIYTVAEVWDNDRITEQYEVALNCFDFTVAKGDGLIYQCARKGNVNDYTKYVEQYIDTIKEKNTDAMFLPFIANHDMDRAAGFLPTSSGLAYVAANVYLLGPGSPFIYYGEEIGLKGSRGSAQTDANRRLAMLWGDGDKVKDPVGADYKESNRLKESVADQIKDSESLYSYYKKVIMVRRANPEIAAGEYTALSFADTKAGGFISTYEGSSVCVIHNTTQDTITLDLSKATDLSFEKITAILNHSGDKAKLKGKTLTIPGQTSVVLR